MVKDLTITNKTNKAIIGRLNFMHLSVLSKWPLVYLVKRGKNHELTTQKRN